MNVQLNEDHNNLIKKIALKEGFSDFEIETRSGSMKGDGYLGVITTVSIKNDNQKLDLILKTAESKEELRKKAPIRAAYLREIYIYETVFQEFDKFQKAHGVVDRLSGIAKVYGSCDKEKNECVILENLRETGYKLWNRKDPMNSEHIALVLAEYGKLHAMSLALNNKKPEEFKKLAENLENIFKKSHHWKSLSNMRQNVLRNGLKAVKGNNFATEALKRFSGEIDNFFNTDLATVEDQIVVAHGDCWCNNMMFKYEDSHDVQKPTKVCIIDWQLARIGSPVLDLSYFFLACSPKDVLNDYERYLKIYHDSICETLQKFSCDVETVFPFTLLMYHWRKYSKFGLYMSLMILKLMLSEEDEIPDLTKTAESEDFFDNISREIIHANNYNQRVLDIVTFMVENKII